MTTVSDTAAVLVAGGSGVRMGAAVRKQYLGLCGVPVLARTLAVFAKCPEIGRLVLVAPQKDHRMIREEILAPHLPGLAVRLVPGGARRQDSVYNGLLAAAGAEYVAVHDAVRPLVSPEEIAACVAAAREHGAAILAAPVTETVKRGEGGVIRETVDRGGLWLAQTPQVFRHTLLLQAHERARREKWDVTDDASMLERLHIAVRLVPGSRKNIKITTPEDLALACLLVAAGEAGGKPSM